MHSSITRFSQTSAQSEFRRAQAFTSDEGDLTSSDAAWGSQAGFGNLSHGVPTFTVPEVADPSAFLRLHTNDAENPDCRIKFNHGTTTLAFTSRAASLLRLTRARLRGAISVASGTVKKVIEINPYLLGTLAGTAADCQYWETYLGMHCRLHELRNGERISVAAASRFLSNLVYSYKGMGLGMGTMICGWDKTGPSIYYVDSGSRLKGNLFSVGSGSTHAYGVLDQGYHWDLTVPEAYELARRSIYAAGHRDAYTGNSCNLYHVEEGGWRFIGNYDISKLHYEGPGNILGADGTGYGYDIRVKGRSSAENRSLE
ncbi:20S proteasome subunit [Mycena sanguinolenta]|nr:20S proteasome subunit [Mycena sanguinolenta]